MSSPSEHVVKDGTAYCANLGYPYRQLSPALKDIYRESQKLVDDAAPDSRLLDLAEYVLCHNHNDFFVLEGSAWHEALGKQVESGRVKVCTRLEACRLALARKTFLFMDMQEFRHGIGLELLTFTGVFPPGIVTFNQLRVLDAHFDYVTGMAKRIDDAAKAISKKYVFLTNHSYDDYVLCDIMYLLANSIDMVSKSCFMGNFAFAEIGSKSVLDERHFSKIDVERYAMLVSNGAGLGVGVNWKLRSLRAFMVKANRCEYHFIHGSEHAGRRCQVAYPPLIFWGFPWTGSGRMLSVWAAIMQHLGITFSVDCEFSPRLTIWYDYYHRQNENIFDLDFSEYTECEAVVNLYKTLPHSSCMFLHNVGYRINDIISETGAKVIVNIRDMRDAFVTRATSNGGGWIRYHNRDANGLLKYAMEDGECLRRGTERLVAAKDNPNILFIKFEDIHRDPVGAYKNLVAALFPDDPVVAEESLHLMLVEAVEKSLPRNISRYTVASDFSAALGLTQTIRGTPGRWREYFDEELKEYFKANSNGFLQAFGYETDDNW